MADLITELGGSMVPMVRPGWLTPAGQNPFMERGAAWPDNLGPAGGDLSNRIRGRAMAIATAAQWIANYAVSQTFPIVYKDAYLKDTPIRLSLNLGSSLAGEVSVAGLRTTCLALCYK